MIGCPSCGAVLDVRIEAITAPAAERRAWRSLRDVSRLTGEPVGRLRRLVREGAIEAREGARGAYLIRAVDVEQLADELPRVVVVEEPSAVDEIARLRTG